MSIDDTAEATSAGQPVGHQINNELPEVPLTKTRPASEFENTLAGGRAEALAFNPDQKINPSPITAPIEHLRGPGRLIHSTADKEVKEEVRPEAARNAGEYNAQLHENPELAYPPSAEPVVEPPLVSPTMTAAQEEWKQKSEAEKAQFRAEVQAIAQTTAPLTRTEPKRSFLESLPIIGRFFSSNKNLQSPRPTVPESAPRTGTFAPPEPA